MSYDAARLLFEAIERAGSLDPEAIREQLQATEDYVGGTRIARYDANRHPVKSSVILTIRDGEKRFHRQIDPPLRGHVVMNDTGTDAVNRWGSDAYKLNVAAITDDTLTITVSYGGGCADHDFTLVTSGAFMESDPVQIEVFMAHDANGDRCKAYLTEAYAFDLVPIKTLYQEAYREDTGTIVLLLRDVSENVSDLIYAFGP